MLSMKIELIKILFRNKLGLILFTLFTIQFQAQEGNYSFLTVNRYDNGDNAKNIDNLIINSRELQVGYQPNYNVFKDKPKINGAKCDGQNCDFNKSYNKISFNLGYDVYCKGKIIKRVKWQRGSNNAYYYVEPDGPIYHKNGQIFIKDPGNNLKSVDVESSLFHPNGKLYQKITKDPLNKYVQVYEEYDKEGSLVRRFSSDKQYGDEGKKENFNGLPVYYTNYGAGRLPSPDAIQPFLQTLKNNDSYFGYTAAGSYYSIENITFAGFFLPTIKELGNGSVVFMEDNTTQKAYWALIINGKIEMTVPANLTDKPNIDDLINKLGQSYKTIVKMRAPKLDAYEYLKNNYMVLSDGVNPYCIANVDSGISPSYSGYGISMKAVDSLFPGQVRYLKVGQFKNGKLNGLGYRCKITHLFQNKYFIDPTTSDGRYSPLDMKIDAQIGIFENGELIKGRRLNNVIQKEDNEIWEKMPLEGINFVNKEVPFEYKYLGQIAETTSLNYLKPGDKVYVKTLKREMIVHSVNEKDRSFKIETDEKNVYATITRDFSEVYCKVMGKKEVEVNCNPEVLTEKFKIIDVKNTYNHSSYISPVIFYKDGLKYLSKGQTVDYKATWVSKQKVSDGYTKSICKLCNGTGKRKFSKDYTRVVKLSF